MTWKRWGACEFCGKEFRLSRDGMVRAHGHPARRCPGSWYPPEKVTREERPHPDPEVEVAAEDSGDGYAYLRCPDCEQTWIQEPTR